MRCVSRRLAPRLSGAKGSLLFVPFLGLAMGAALGAFSGKLVKTTIDKEFQQQVQAALEPGTSALFPILEQMTEDKAMEGLSKFGGTVIKTSLSKEAEAELQEALQRAGA